MFSSLTESRVHQEREVTQLHPMFHPHPLTMSSGFGPLLSPLTPNCRSCWKDTLSGHKFLPFHHLGSSCLGYHDKNGFSPEAQKHRSFILETQTQTGGKSVVGVGQYAQECHHYCDLWLLKGPYQPRH